MRWCSLSTIIPQYFTWKSVWVWFIRETCLNSRFLIFLAMWDTFRGNFEQVKLAERLDQRLMAALDYCVPQSNRLRPQCSLLCVYRKNSRWIASLCLLQWHPVHYHWGLSWPQTLLQNIWIAEFKMTRVIQIWHRKYVLASWHKAFRIKFTKT